jgi:hypothetical protein
MSFESDAQIIVQTRNDDGSLSRRSYRGLPLVHSALVAFEHAPFPVSRHHSEALWQRLDEELLAMSSLPPEPSGEDPAAHPHVRKVLVLVGALDEAVPISPAVQRWLRGDDSFRLLPVFPFAARRGVSGLLPKGVEPINVAWWHDEVGEVLPALLAVAGVTAERPRIFISYRQGESAALAMQVYDALDHRGFDVFLDHYRIPPGLDFQVRLTQELGDKAVVLVIESGGILDSEWTTYEINVAKECRLGLLALHPPGGTRVPGVDEDDRYRLRAADFDRARVDVDARLTEAALTSVVRHVERQHDRALVRRRQILRTSMDEALAWEGVGDRSLDASGVLHVVAPTGTNYRVWLTPRPPDLDDFHTTHLHSRPPARGVVIGLSRLMEPPRVRRTDWLAGVCSIRFYDEGRLSRAAADIARGVA